MEIILTLPDIVISYRLYISLYRLSIFVYTAPLEDNLLLISNKIPLILLISDIKFLLIRLLIISVWYFISSTFAESPLIVNKILLTSSNNISLKLSTPEIVLLYSSSIYGKILAETV